MICCWIIVAKYLIWLCQAESNFNFKDVRYQRFLRGFQVNFYDKNIKNNNGNSSTAASITKQNTWLRQILHESIFMSLKQIWDRNKNICPFTNYTYRLSHWKQSESVSKWEKKSFFYYHYVTAEYIANSRPKLFNCCVCVSFFSYSFIRSYVLWIVFNFHILCEWFKFQRIPFRSYLNIIAIFILFVKLNMCGCVFFSVFSFSCSDRSLQPLLKLFTLRISYNGQT